MYALRIIPYLNLFTKLYENIIVINKLPEGPLNTYVKTIKNNTLSPFQKTDGCVNAILSIKNINNLMNVEELPDLICFISEKGYEITNTIDLKGVLCFFKNN